MEKVEKQKNHNLFHKGFLIVLKYIPHFIAFIYAIYTLLGFCGIDSIVVGCFFHISLVSWIYLFITSLLFKFCYVHRLPLYYIGTNELITSLDYYIGIPVEDFNLIIIHSLLIISLIFGYSYYHIKCKLKKWEILENFVDLKLLNIPRLET